jgi:outer membrane protein assembly factor BamB
MELAHRVARSYPIPYLDRVTMPVRWANWLAQRGGRNEKLLAAPEEPGGLKTWRHEAHEPAPWMQFFYDWRFGDLFDTGQLDLLLTCGALRQAAYRPDGKVAWQYDDPDAGFLEIRLDSNFPIVDVDGDGLAEAILPRRVDGTLHLCVVEGATGRVKRSVPYPGMDQRPADLRGSITVVHAHTTMGHTPLACDLDGDGRDELIAGSTVLSSDGEILWVAPDLPAIVKDTHVDSPVVVDWRGDGNLSLFSSTGAYCFRDGALTWGIGETIDHGQAARVVRTRGSTERQIVLYDNYNRRYAADADRVYLLDQHGQVLWRRDFFGPHMQEGGFGFWSGDWDGDGLDEVLVNDLERVQVLKGATGETIGTLPGHLVWAHDLVGDARIDAVVVDKIEPGMRLLVLENSAPGGPEIARRATSPAVYNVTRY